MLGRDGGGLLRPGQDGHRQSVDGGLRWPTPPGRSDQPATHGAGVVERAGLPPPRGRRGADAALSASPRCGSPAGGSAPRIAPLVRETLTDVIDPIVYAEALELIRAAPGRRAPGVPRLRVTRGDRPPARRVPRGRPGHRQPGRASTRAAATPARSTSTRYGPYKAEAIREVAERASTSICPPATPTATRSPTCRCCERSATLRGQPRPRSGPCGPARASGRCCSSATASRCVSGWCYRLPGALAAGRGNRRRGGRRRGRSGGGSWRGVPVGMRRGSGVLQLLDRERGESDDHDEHEKLLHEQTL